MAVAETTTELLSKVCSGEKKLELAAYNRKVSKRGIKVWNIK